MSEALWQPSLEIIEKSNLKHYENWLRQEYNLSFSSYHDLWEWSTKESDKFWSSLISYFDVIYTGKFSDVTSSDPMPHTRWFEGMKLNYAEHILRKSNDENPAIIYTTESEEIQAISWSELENRVARFQAFLIENGVKKGDYVVGYMANVPHASVAFLATAGLGAVWSCCSPDFGVSSVIERFEQLNPKLIIAVSGYSYNNKVFDKRKEAREIKERLPTLKSLVWADFVNIKLENAEDEISWEQALDNSNETILTEHVDFSDPLWVLFSSGTTGKPKAIVHSHGGNLLEHLKYHAFHNDTKPGERFFWFSTTGWMMWNFLHASWLMGATVVLYDGSPALSSLDVLWDFAEKAGINHFGTSAPYIVACMKRGINPKTHDLSALRSIGSTGAPLPPEAYAYVYKNIKEDVWLSSMSGGTDVCTAFVGGNITLPVHRGEIQCRALACRLEAWNEQGEAVMNELGEMVITKAMPSMPVRFMGDDNFEKYHSSYFDVYPGVWRHGDWVKITDYGSLIIYGRSDATLNRHGVRIGTAEIYNVLNQIEGITEALVVNIEKDNGDHFMPLFVALEPNLIMNKELEANIKRKLRTDCSPRHVPDAFVQVQDIPKTISGKIMETPVKKVLMGISNRENFNSEAMKNPKSMDFFFDYFDSLISG